MVRPALRRVATAQRLVQVRPDGPTGGLLGLLTLLLGLLTVLLGLLLPTALLAHPSGLPALRERAGVAFDNAGTWIVWDFHESIVIGTLLLGIGYWLGITRWRVQAKLSETPAPRWQIALFYANLAVLYLSLDGPLHHLADELLFSAHMLQHMLLQLLWAPLLILAVPEWLWRGLYQLPGVRPWARWASRPFVAFFLFNGVIFGWHVPQMYDLALRVHGFHILQHLMFMSTAVVLWFVVIAPLPELRGEFARRMIFVMANMLAMKVLGLTISLADDVLYPFYASQPRAWGMDVLSDQQLGGLLMWMPGGGILWFGLGRVFWQWVRKGTPERGRTGIPEIDARLAARGPVGGLPVAQVPATPPTGS